MLRLRFRKSPRPVFQLEADAADGANVTAKYLHEFQTLLAISASMPSAMGLDVVIYAMCRKVYRDSAACGRSHSPYPSPSSSRLSNTPGFRHAFQLRPAPSLLCLCRRLSRPSRFSKGSPRMERSRLGGSFPTTWSIRPRISYSPSLGVVVEPTSLLMFSQRARVRSSLRTLFVAISWIASYTPRRSRRHSHRVCINSLYAAVVQPITYEYVERLRA